MASTAAHRMVIRPTYPSQAICWRRSTLAPRRRAKTEATTASAVITDKMKPPASNTLNQPRAGRYPSGFG
jgi:hypothetical protein